ncbi:MAG TPA: two-component regulator propeller domain-containing protein, partial [bacterium]|nr:two-component regulator propeller domain-containing protein [bacterium]
MGYRFRLTVIGMLLFLGFIPRMHADVPPHFVNIYSKVYSTRHGLPSNHVSYVTQDRLGRIWVTTQRGIAAYDGHEFTAYPFPEHDEISVYINMLFHDSRDRLWMGTNRGVAFLEKDVVKKLPVNWSGEAPDVSDIVEDASGRIWALCNRNELRRIDNRTLDQPQWADRPEIILVTRVRASESKVIWIATSSGFFIMENDQIRPWKLDQDLSIFEFALDGETSGWLLDEDGVFYRFRDHNLTRLDSLPAVAARSVYDMNIGKTGAVWIATFRGLFLWQHENFRNFRYRNGLASNVIMDVFVDREGALWYGSDNGLGKIPGLMFTRLMPTPDLPISSVSGLCQDARGRIWFAANEGLLCVEDDGIRRWGIEDGLKDDSSYSVVPFGNGVVSCNTYGLFRIDDDNRVQSLSDDTDVSFLNLTVNGDDIWAMGDDGLFLYRPGKELMNMNTLLPVDRPIPVNSVFFDSRNWMWVATDGKGLFVSRKSDRSDFEPIDELPSLRVFSICEDRVHSVWVGTLRGIVHIEDRTVRQVFTRSHGLVSEDIWTVLCDREDGVWISSSRGLSSILNGRVTNYDYNDGLSGEDFISNCRYVDRHGRLWFGGMGVTIVDPSEKMPAVRPLTNFRYARVNGKPLRDGQAIPAGRNTFEFGLMCSS